MYNDGKEGFGGFVQRGLMIKALLQFEGGTLLEPNEQNNRPLTVEPTQSFHPYEDKTLSETQPDRPTVIDDREPFNDVIKHGDIVVGYRRNRTLSDYPRGVRPWIRLYAIAALVLLVIALGWNLIR